MQHLLANLGVYLSLAVGATVAAGIVAATRAARKRVAALEALARQGGWSCKPQEVGANTLGAGPFALFDVGRHQRARNVLRGSTGSEAFVAFDYRYTTGSGKSRSTTHQTVV